MKTVNSNNCPKCNKKTTVKDYYWHKDFENVKKNPRCKECLSKEYEVRKAYKKAELILVF